MYNYVKEDHSIVQSDLKLDFRKVTKKNIEEAYDGSLWEKGYAPEESLIHKLDRLENEYQMPRYVREGILAEGSPYSDFTKARARELEDIAEQIRKL